MKKAERPTLGGQESILYFPGIELRLIFAAIQVEQYMKIRVRMIKNNGVTTKTERKVIKGILKLK